ncbi:protein kinase domain-containing protein [Spirillospora sp. CA-294931]|uniref:protein kinase domain-containing protein n=1 Tax=Spirillospora sp. CA-294931 TaxID=3240042 RepID=UPI003D9412A7
MDPLLPDDPPEAGPYRLLARLGAGGMGVVYLGRSRGGRTVAVKVIRSRFVDDPRYRARFGREVGAARRVAGTFTAPVLDADPDAPAPWLATAYLPGLSLRAAVAAHGAMPPDAVRALAAGLAEALAAIHGAGVVHRDLKPENVLLTAGGPRVIDFGIARPEEATAITRPGAVVGTPGFMAPEQVAGEAVGPPGDVFTLGAVLAYAATGSEPFGTGSIRSRQYRVMTVQADLDGVTEPLLAEVIAACLRREPERRPSAGEVLEMLGPREDSSLQGTRWLPAPVAEAIDRRAAEAARSVPAAAAPRVAAPAADLPTADPEAAPAIDRRTLIAGAGAGVLAVSAGGALLWPRDDPRPRTAAKTRPSGPAPTPRPVLRWKRKVSGYYPDLTVAGATVLAKTERAVHALDARTGRVRWEREADSLPVSAAGDVVFVTAPVSGRLTAVRAATNRTLWTKSTGPGETPVSGPVVSGSTAFYGYTKVVAVDMDDGATRWTADISPENGLAVDGDLVVALNAALVGLDARTGRTRWTYKVHDAGTAHIGHGMVFTSDSSGVLHAVRADTGRPAWRRPDGGSSFFLQIGDGVLYTSSADGTVLACETATGRTVWSRRLGNGEGASYGRSSTLGLHGGTLHVSCTDRHVYALDASTGRTRWVYAAEATLRSGPVSAAGLVFLGTRDGSVHALSEPPHAAP